MACSNRTALALIVTGVLLGATGCQSQYLPIGGGDPNASGGGSSPGDEGSSEAALLVARWEGYVENFQFRSGSDAIRIDIDSVAGGEIHGSVRFGTGPSLSPPTDPHVGYPPSADPLPHYDTTLPYEGFDFTMLGAQLTERRLRFSIDPRELWTGWCELQTSYRLVPDADAYSCIPNESTTFSSVCLLGTQPADCGYLDLCKWMVCDCGESGCTVDARPSIDFDFVVEPQAANGSMSRDGIISNVRLTREP